MTIPTLTSLPVAPARTDTPAVFVTRADAFLAAIVTFQGEMNTSITAMNTDIAGVNADAVTASNAASAAAASAAAAQSASNATAWVSGQTYAAGATVYSLINYKSYRAITGTSGTTDPSASADWTALGYGLPSQSGNADKFLQTDGTNESWQDVPASGGTYTATSSGAIASGDTIVVNTDGTISSVTGSDNPNSVTTTNYMTGNGSLDNAVCYDTTNDRLVVAYSRDGVGVQARVGTVATNGTVTWGTEVSVETGNSSEVVIAFDEDKGKIVFAYRNSSSYSKARPATVDPSNNSLTLGTAIVFMSTTTGTNGIQMTYDSDQNHLIAFTNNTASSRAELRSFQLSGTGVNLTINVSATNSAVYANVNYISVAYDRDASQVLCFYSNTSASSAARATAGSWTGSGTSGYYIFNNGESIIDTSSTSQQALCYDPISKQIVAFWLNGSNQSQARCIKAGTNNTLTLGTQLGTDEYTQHPEAVYNSLKQYIVLVWKDYTGSNSAFGALRTFTVSGTTITATPTYVFQSSTWDQVNNIAYDPDKNYTFAGSYNPSTGAGDLAALQVAFTDTNLSDTRWIGVSNAAYADGVSAEIKTRGTVITNSNFKDTSTVENFAERFGPASYDNNLVYDSNVDRYLLTYRDRNNSDYFTGVVIQISAAGVISYGTPQVISSQGYAQQSGVAFDSNLNKFFICFRQAQGLGYGLVAVINPANNSATYGTPTEFTSQTGEASAATYFSCAFDTNSNKFCMTYQSYTPDVGACRVAYINDSTNTVTFGAEHQYYSAGYGQLNAVAFDPNLNKFINAYSIGANATVNAITLVIDSSTNTISSGTSVQIATGFGASMGYGPQIVYNSTAQKFVIVYTKSGGAGIAAVTASITDSTNAVVLGTITDFDGSFYPEITEGADSTVYVASRGGDGSNASSYQQLTINGTNLTSGGVNTYHNHATVQAAYNAVIYVGGRLTIVVDYYDIASAAMYLYTFSFERAIQPATPYFVNFDGSIVSISSDNTVPMGTGLNSTTIFTKGV